MLNCLSSPFRLPLPPLGQLLSHDPRVVDLFNLGDLTRIHTYPLTQTRTRSILPPSHHHDHHHNTSPNMMNFPAPPKANNAFATSSQQQPQQSQQQQQQKQQQQQQTFSMTGASQPRGVPLSSLGAASFALPQASASGSSIHAAGGISAGISGGIAGQKGSNGKKGMLRHQGKAGWLIFPVSRRPVYLPPSSPGLTISIHRIIDL